MQVCEFIFTARFAWGTEGAENNKFSIAVDPAWCGTGTPAMEKH